MDLIDPAKIKIGTPVKMTVIERGPEGQGKKFLAFKPL
jgi:uncharacterized OB-fold protein